MANNVPVSSVYRDIVSDIIGWDVACWKGALDMWDSIAGPFSGKTVLEIGAGGGGLSLYFSLQGCRVICTDFPQPSEKAVRLHAEYNVGELISYESANALALPFSECRFDIVVMKSVLPAVGAQHGYFGQKDALEQVRLVLKPGGRFLFAENLFATKAHYLLRLLFAPWAKRCRYVDYAEIDDLFKNFSAVEYECRGITSLLGRNTKVNSVLSKLDSLLYPVVPERFRYVMFGCATK